MTAELLPAGAVAGSAPPAGRERAIAAGCALLVSLAFWSPLLLGGDLHGRDWSTHHFHYFDWVRVSFSEFGVIPLYMADAWVTPNFLANAESPTFGPFAWLLLWLPTGVYVKLLLILLAAVGLAGGYLLCRELGASPPVAGWAAGVYALSGFFVSHLTAGHHWAMGAWWLPLLLLLTRRAILGSVAAGVAAACVDAFTILGGQHQPFVWQNLVLSLLAVLWALRARSLAPLLRWGAIASLAMLLAGVKLGPLLAEFADYAPQARIQGLPLTALPTALLGRGQHPELVQAGVRYAHGAGWWEYAFYIGPLGAVLGLAGIAAARSLWPIAVLGGFFALLSLEPSPLFAWIDDLPIWRSQRCPARFLAPALFALTLVGALGLERLRTRAAARWPAATLVAWALALAAVGDLWLESRIWQHSATGPAIERRDHQPRPRQLTSDGVEMRLAEFAPNRLVYSAEASRAGWVVLPLRHGKRELEWRILGARAAAEARSWIAVEVPEGKGLVTFDYRPTGLWAGCIASAVGAVLALGALGLARRRRTA